MRAESDQLTLSTLDGETVRLALGASSRPVAFLDGHIADITGTRAFGVVRVVDWKVTEGLHGLPAWAGVLEWQGVQVGLADRNSGAYYLLDRDAAEALGPYVGKTALIEGYVDGPHRVRVVYYRILAE